MTINLDFPRNRTPMREVDGGDAMNTARAPHSLAPSLALERDTASSAARRCPSDLVLLVDDCCLRGACMGSYLTERLPTYRIKVVGSFSDRDALGESSWMP